MTRKLVILVLGLLLASVAFAEQHDELPEFVKQMILETVEELDALAQTDPGAIRKELAGFLSQAPSTQIKVSGLHLMAATATSPEAQEAIQEMLEELEGEEESPPRKIVTVLKHATLIDGNGGAPFEDAAIVIEDDTILDILHSDDENIPADAGVVINLEGQVVIPGLIDAHTHLATDPSGGDNRASVEQRLRHNLYGGVTTMRDMAGDVRALADLARDASLDEIESPDIFYVAVMAGPSFFSDPRTVSSGRGRTPGQTPWMRAVTPETDMREAVSLAKGTGASGIKIYANLPAEEVRRITEEAHRQGLQVWTHAAVLPAGPMDAVKAGADTITHIDMLALEAVPEARTSYIEARKKENLEKAAAVTGDDPAIQSLFQEMVSRGTILDATFSMYFYDDVEGLEEVAPMTIELFQAAHDAGVQIAAGTDYFTEDEAYPALIKEIETFVEHGMTPLEAITSATLISARAVGIDKTHGTVEKGKTANLVILNANPVERIRNLRKIDFVMKNGRIYRRDTYRPPTEG